MAMPSASEFKRIVRAVMEDPDRLPLLIDDIKSPVRAMAMTVDRLRVDELEQAAWIRIAAKIYKVQLRRPAKQVRDWFLVIARSAMLDDARAERASRRGLTISHEVAAMTADQPPRRLAREQAFEFPPPLDLYLDYVERHGSFAGAHRAVGRILRVPRGTAYEQFHAATDALVARYGLRGQRRYDRAVAAILSRRA